MNIRRTFSPEGGIPKERVISYPGDQEALFNTLECLICGNIAFNPRECSNCKKAVCLYCLTMYKEENNVHMNHCPGEGCIGGQFDLNQVGEVMLNLLEFKCHNKQCGEKLKYADLDKHECEFDYFRCEAPECKEDYARYEIDNHEDVCPKMPLNCLYQVNGCNLVINRENMKMHKDGCEFKPLSCDKCGLNSILKRDLKEHEKICPMEEIVCEECGTEMIREELALHSCIKSMAQKIGVVRDWIYLKDNWMKLNDNVIERILHHNKILEEAKIIDFKKYKKIDERIAEIESREKHIEDTTRILMTKQVLIDDKQEAAEKREIDLEKANMAYLRNSQELLVRMKGIEEREDIIEQRSHEMEEKHKELMQKMINIEDRERTLEESTQIHAQKCEVIRIKMEEIEDREISQMNNIHERMNEFEQRTSTLYVEIRARITELDEREHRQDIDLQKLNKKTKEFEEKSKIIKKLMEIHGIGINFDGYVSASKDKSLIFMDQEMKVIRKYQSPKAREYIRVIQLRDRRIAASNNNGSIEIIDPITHKLLFTLTGHKDGDNIWGLIELNNGNLVSGSNDKSIKIWDLESKSCAKTLIGHSGYVFSLLEHSSGKLISGGGIIDRTSRMWDVISGECTNILNYVGNIWEMIELPNGEVLSICDSKSISLRIWDPQTGHIISDIDSQYQWTTGCRVNESTLFLGNESGWVVEFNLNYLQFGKKFKLHDRWVFQLFRVSDTFLISASGDNKVKMFNMDDGRIVHTMEQHNDQVFSVIGLQLKI